MDPNGRSQVIRESVLVEAILLSSGVGFFQIGRGGK